MAQIQSIVFLLIALYYHSVGDFQLMGWSIAVAGVFALFDIAAAVREQK